MNLILERKKGPTPHKAIGFRKPNSKQISKILGGNKDCGDEDKENNEERRKKRRQ